MPLMRSLLLSSLVLVLALPGCTPDRAGGGDGGIAPRGDGGTPPPKVTPLVVTPPDQILGADGTKGAAVTYKATQGDKDVTGQASWWADNGVLGAFAGSTFTTVPGIGGKTTIHAQLGDAPGQTTLTVRVTAVVVGPGAPGNSPGMFGGPPDPSKAPMVAYPPPGALLPPNLDELEVQWQPQGGALFMVQFLGDALDLKIYTPCVTAGTGCAFTPDEATWKLLSSTSRAQTLKLSVSAALPGGTVGTSAAQPLSFTQEDMSGGLYYWAASAGGIMRYDFGLRAQKAEVFYNPIIAAQNGVLATCVGCHAMSRNGKRMAAGMNIPSPAFMRAMDVGTRKTLFDVGGKAGLGGSNFQAYTPDGSFLVTAENAGLTLRDGTDGTLIGLKGALPDANMPDFSPDGKTIVFAREPVGPTEGLCGLGLVCPNLQVSNASLYTVPFTGTGFGKEVLLLKAAGADNYYYPAYSPDGKFIAFNLSQLAMSTSYDASDAQVMVIPSGGGAPLNLKSVNAQIGNSWPKWSPFQHHFQGAPILWLSFSTRRSYGLRATPDSQIWLVPVDAAKLAQGQDSGYPPIRLPFQSLATGNHIAQWVETVERAPCDPLDKADCMPDEMCVDGVCIPILG